MSDTDAHWGTDSPVSMPQATLDPNAEKVDLGGFVFTPQGLAFDLSSADREALISLPFRPDGPNG